MAKPQTVEEYIEGFSGPAREVLVAVRSLARRTVPTASEELRWSQPAWLHPSGTILFMLSGYTRHANVAFTPSTRAAFDADLSDFATGKGTVKLPYGEPVPEALLLRMMAFRVREHEQDGVLWM